MANASGPRSVPERLGTRAGAWLPALLVALYPLSSTLAVNVTWLPIPASDIGRAAAATLVVTVLLLAGLQRFDRVPGTTAVWLAALLLPMVAYGWICDVSGLDREDWRVAIVYTIVGAALASVAMRPWTPGPRDPVPLLIVGAVMVSANAIQAVWSRPADADRARWQEAAKTLTRVPASTTPATPTRDIYYIVLDGFGRPDVLRDGYDLDLQPFVAFLRDRGFYVPEHARSNYGQTYLSLASTLNMQYLDELVAAMGASARDRHPLQYAIRTNALMALARGSGYRVTAITSDYEATLAFDAADRCTCQRMGLTELEQVALAATPLAALPLRRWTADAHRRHVQDSFGALEDASSEQGRTFVFAHVIAPHPPFLFNADGSPRQPRRALMGFRDGSHFPGSREEYIAGYRNQTRFVVQRLTTLVTRLLDGPGPKPAIVIHGDHGPGARLDWQRPERSDVRERMGIFAAYLLPGESRDVPTDTPTLYDTMTPVNGARALATQYFGVRLPFLPDHGHFSGWERPFEVVGASSH